MINYFSGVRTTVAAIAVLTIFLFSASAAEGGFGDESDQIAGCSSDNGRFVDFPEQPAIISFESGIAPVTVSAGSLASISSLHSKLGSNSLLWEWKRKGATLVIPGEIPYMAENPNPKETSVSSFVFNVYSESPIDGELTISFWKGDQLCCSFRYGLNFTGWRGAWVAFDRDMTGTPAEGMDKVVIAAPEGVRKGRLFFDGIITAAFEDIRHHTADFQAPFINASTTSHWLVLLQSWNASLDIQPGNSVSDNEIAEMETIRSRFIDLVAGGKKPKTAQKLRETFESYEISENEDGTIKGKPIFFTRYGETFINVCISDASARFSKAGQLLRPANDFLADLAVAWLNADDAAWKSEIENMYITLTRHLLDQGFAAGSSLGTLHHLGYSMKNFYTAPVIMRDVLVREGLAEEVRQAMEWFSGVGEVKTAPTQPGMDIDAFNTSLMGRAAALIMLEDTPYKVAYLKAFSRWIDNGFRYADGLSPAFKTDGTVQHHRKAYPAYATGGFDGAVKAVWMLRGTEFSISPESHGILKRALMEMRFYCNLKSFPLAMSGRHPDGLGALIPEQYALLADAGPTGSSCAEQVRVAAGSSAGVTNIIDYDLAAAYLRLKGYRAGNAASDGGAVGSPANKTDKWSRKFLAANIAAEKSPTGCHVYPFNCSMSYRHDDFLVTFAGHSRYLWATETYNGANHYGRYLTHGSMQILADGSPEIDSFGSGYRQEGWDWCHIPGTTAAQIPMQGMKANVLNVDEFSGYEEMLLSDEWFAGGVSHRDSTGAYAMILHEHDKYNGSLRAHKSWFAFGNRIVALGSELQNMLPGSELHTTLFQNAIPDPGISTAPSGEPSQQSAEEFNGNVTLRDRFGNAWFVRDARVKLFCGLQHSFHEETDAPTSGYFEKAYIYHGSLVSPADGDNSAPADGGQTEEYSKPSYEYMTLVHPTEAQMEDCSKSLPYEVLCCDDTAHIIRDLGTGITAGAIFQPYSASTGSGPSSADGTASDLSTSDGGTLLLEASPCIIMYSVVSDTLTVSLSNPDLNLYEGESDELYDKDGKRIERSVYSRTWLDNHCGPTAIEITLAGKWTLADSPANTTDSDKTDTGSLTLTFINGNTHIHIDTREARTEEIALLPL